MRYLLYLCLTLVLLLSFACSPAAKEEAPLDADAPATPAPTNPHAGTWTLNVAKSSYSPGPAPKSQTLKIEAWGEDGLSYVAEGVGADDKPTRSEFQAKFDGKDYEFKGNPDGDALSYKVVDPNTLEATVKRKGTAVITANVVVSADGKTRTVTQTGKDAKGRDMKTVSVYEKQ